MNETLVDGVKAVCLVIAGLASISWAIVLFMLKSGVGFWIPDLGPYVLMEVTILGIVGLCMFVWASLSIANILSKVLALRRAKQ